MLGSTRKQTTEDYAIPKQHLHCRCPSYFPLREREKKTGSNQMIRGYKNEDKGEEWESENKNQINTPWEGDPEWSSRQYPGRRPGSSRPCNDNTRTLFSMLLWCLKIALDLRGNIPGDWGMCFPPSVQHLLLTVPQKDWHGMAVPQETQMRHLGVKFVIVASRERRAFSERQQATLSSSQHQGEALMDLSFFSTTSLPS